MISIVTSLYRSAPYIEEFYRRHLACLQTIGADYEFVFVNDGSPDNSAEVAIRLTEIDQNVRVVLLSRNFGQYPAMFAGMAYAKGDLVYTMDCDLEEDPENLLRFHKIITGKEEVDFVFGTIAYRTGGFVRGFLGNIFFKLMASMSEVRLHENMSWQILMSRRYLDALLQYHEAETLAGGLMVLTGFNQRGVNITKSFKGSTTYPFSKRLKLAVNSITAFSSKPLVMIAMLGLSITLLAFLSVCFVVIRKLFFVDSMAGWTSVFVSVWLIGGLILSSVGVVGIYLSKVFNQVKGRPLYIVKEVVQKKHPT